MDDYYNVAENLTGLTVNGWTIQKPINHKPSTGGNFSYGYEVINQEKRIGFMKALDYSRAFRPGAKVDELNAMTSAYMFERDLLVDCMSKRLKHVVTIIDAGRYSPDITTIPLGKNFYPVDYLIMEKADESIRNIIDISKSFDLAWMLRSLHNVAVGIAELHSIQIAHQDIKPSNILVFKDNGTSKIGDIGRSISQKRHAEHEKLNYAGDWQYSPLELLYGKILPDWKKRRYSCDMYMFGNLIVTYFNNVSLTTSILYRLSKGSLPGAWPESYDDVLPQIEMAFSECLDEFNKSIPKELREELVSMVKQLCEPDVEKRGDVQRQYLGSQQYSLQKYITRLDYLARKYEHTFERIVI